MSDNLEYLPEKFTEYLKSQISFDFVRDRERNLKALKLIKNELIGQSDTFKRKLVSKVEVLDVFLKIIDNFRVNDPNIIKEVITILNCLFQFLRQPMAKVSLVFQKDGP